MWYNKSTVESLPHAADSAVLVTTTRRKMAHCKDFPRFYRFPALLIGGRSEIPFLYTPSPDRKGILFAMGTYVTVIVTIYQYL